MKKVRLGIIGVGVMGQGHIRLLRSDDISGVELTALCDVKDECLAPYRGDEKIYFYNDSKKLIRSGNVDAVVIATPHYDHTTIGIDALQQGLHVMVEKPISVHKADCEKLIKAHTNKRQVFAAMFNQRTDGCYRKIKQMIDNGELGEITRVNWIITQWFRTQAYFDMGGWRATWSGEGGGVLLNQSPHQLDLMWWLFGAPKKVRAFCHIGKGHDIEVDDEVTAYLEYKNGATGVFITSTCETPGTNRLEVCGDMGKLVCEGDSIEFFRNEISMKKFCKTSKKAFGTPAVWSCKIPSLKQGGQHKEVLQNFLDTVLKKAKLIAPAKEGIHSVELANAMLLSSILDKPIEMPMDGKRYERELKKLICNSTMKKKTVKKAEVNFGDSQ